MIVDGGRGSEDRTFEKNQSSARDLSRRKALGRLGAYTAPAMLAMLLSEPAAAASLSNNNNVSDIRLKRDIVQVARLPNGLGLYRYRYLDSDTAYVGVMAHEVEPIVPEAVVHADDGYLRVDYARLGLRLQTWDDWTAAA
jgi:Chaperone of endosialidase